MRDSRGGMRQNALPDSGLRAGDRFPAAAEWQARSSALELEQAIASAGLAPVPAVAVSPASFEHWDT